MILHIQSDHFASDPCLKRFQAAFPHKNIAVRLHESDKTVTIIKEGEEKLFENAKEATKSIDYSTISIVVVYHLDFQKVLFIVGCVPKQKPIVWWMYGWDLYTRLWHKGYDLYAPQTLSFIKKEKKGLVLKMKLFLEYIYRNYYDKKVLKRIVGVVPCELPDYNLSLSLFKKKVDHIDIFGRSLIQGMTFSTGNDIVVGHSASMSVNHLYALDILKRFDIGDSRIVLPLSYTVQSDLYRRGVMEEYNNRFGSNVRFLLEYQDIETYRNNFLNYKVAIYPSWRQEALGNINICFQLGIKVFLSKHNPCLEYYKEKGFVIYALEEIQGETDLCPLTQEQKEKNLAIYLSIKNERDRVAPINLKAYFAKYAE